MKALYRWVGYVAISLFAVSTSVAQQVVQSGNVTPGQAVRWVSNGIVGSGGTPTNPLLTGVGVLASGPAICSQSGTSNYNRICIGATSTAGIISLDNVGSATGGFTLRLNGVSQGFPTVTLPVTTDDFVCFANTTGTLKDCGISAVSAINQPSTGFFWTAWDAAGAGIPAPPGQVSPLARINRLNDRVFVGGATVNSSNFPSTVKDYLEAWEVPRSDPRGFRTSFAQFSSLSTIGAHGIIGATRSSDNEINGLQATIGVGGYAINNKPGGFGLGVYGIAWRTTGALFTGAAEFEIADEQVGGGDQVYPSAFFPANNTHAVLIGSGGASALAVGDASFALGITDVGRKFKSGIVFKADSLVRDGSSIASAVRLAQLHALEWYRTDAAATAPSFSIYANVGTQANAQRISATDTGVYIGSADGTRPALSIPYFGTLQDVYPSIAGGTGTVVLQAIPISGANAGISVRSQGTGITCLGSAAGDTFCVSAAGNFLAGTNNTRDIGAVADNRPRTIYAATSMIAPSFVGAVTGNATTATTLATPRAIYGNDFDGSAALTQIIASTFGGTGNGFAKFTGPTTSEKSFALPDASATILTSNALVTPAQGGTGVNNGANTLTLGGSLTTSAAGSICLGSWTPYAPVAAQTGATLGTATGRYCISGKTVLYQISVPVTTAGTGIVTASLPAAAPTTAAFTFTGAGVDNGVSGAMLQSRIDASTSTVLIVSVTGTNPASNGSVLNVNGIYEVP